MSARKALIVVGIVAVIVAAAVYKLLNNDAATSSHESLGSSFVPSSPTVPSVPPASPPTREAGGLQSAEDAARQGLTVAYTWYPASDASQGDAYERARPWFSDALASTFVNEVPERGPGIQWERWAHAGATVIADVILGCSGCPPDTDNVIHRVATINQTAITDDKVEKVTPTTTLWVTVTRVGDRWLIDSIRY